jgi:hypothetical protein
VSAEQPNAKTSTSSTGGADSAQTQTNRALPDIDEARAKREGVNIRMARAGLFILEGRSVKQALIKAGYSRVTASKPRANGLAAERCLAEAAKLDRSADSRTLVARARRVLARSLDGLVNKTDDQLSVPRQLNATAKVVEVVERYHGRGLETPRDLDVARTLAERVILTKLIVDELLARGAAGPVINVEARGSTNGAPRRALKSPEKGSSRPVEG